MGSSHPVRGGHPSGGSGLRSKLLAGDELRLSGAALRWNREQSAIGIVEGLIDGAISGFILASLYNTFAHAKTEA